MNKDDFRDFANRNWNEISNLDHSHWATEYQRNGALSAHKTSQTLWRHMKSIRPDWPDALDRKRDLENHIALKQLFICTSNAFSAR